MKYGSKWPTYAEQWDAMVINPSREAEFRRYAQFAIDHKAEYFEIEQATGVTWPHVAVLHRRESDSDFSTYLGNGQPLNRVTTIVPKGRGPFPSFLAGAIDAFAIDGLDKVIDWRLEKILYYCEIFNGLGYENKGLPSPYIWGGTNQQRSGKYVADGVFDPNVMDTQPGCAPILAMIAKLDPAVRFVRETPPGVEPPTTEPPMADANMRAVLDAVEKLASEITITRMEVATLRSLVTGVPAKPAEPKEPPKPTEPPPVVTERPPTDPLKPVNFGSLIASIAAMIALPANNVTATVDQGTLGSLLPLATAVASGFGLPGWILPIAGRLIGRLTGANK